MIFNNEFIIAYKIQNYYLIQSYFSPLFSLIIIFISAMYCFRLMPTTINPVTIKISVYIQIFQNLPAPIAKIFKF